MKIHDKKNMKQSSTIKTVVVRLTADNVTEYDIDTDIFDDPYLEAATRAVEISKAEMHSIIRAVAECWDKKIPKKSYMYNSYWILVNAACYNKAELLREKFKAQTDCDLALEPKHGRNPTNS
jgi:hypothetical protein